MTTERAEEAARPGHEHEAAGEGLSNKLNWLRAGVLGANDGIVSTAGVVMGVAGATDSRSAIFIAGAAALVAGALSMAAGEYVSVSTQRDAEMALIEAERRDLERMPEEELDQLMGILENAGMSEDVAHRAAEQLTKWNALRVHAKLEFNIDLDDVTNPWAAAGASALSFTIGALLPVLMILLPADVRIWATLVSVAVALAVTGYTSARIGYAKPWPAVLRNVAGGVLAMVVTWAIGTALGTHI